jgi:hypothetical protein
LDIDKDCGGSGLRSVYKEDDVDDDDKGDASNDDNEVDISLSRLA